MTTPTFEISVLISANREAGLTIPRALPMHWCDLNAEGRDLCLWYIHNTLSYFDKTQVARHIIGLEILDNERAKISPVMTAQRADEIWKLVFNK
jgi:hypothetical protein